MQWYIANPSIQIVHNGQGWTYSLQNFSSLAQVLSALNEVLEDLRSKNHAQTMQPPPGVTAEVPVEVVGEEVSRFKLIEID